ncbi:GDP-L-fucose synthase [Sulfuricurvum sp. RIFCSPLOWO2_12_FULL_43_24]|uniref:GDP-L-fucose synthase family protein n=1 Tax=Sulfuricurvum sp. RIFCSPLOWO2_12_FULL_43_24 TaxID=1802247 RepID=UPI0008D8AB2E|nr:GDP-L-fucose synthase [Sulfuricurvum sp. RIFCSPLOWO2_12_FULL_43_24]OHD90002.1 MAG: GDP-fucose synthetase [Sulfuricurvum sp. RIFCSPLOWO2_12_FULL_43_24]OHD92774.1 MAG: GDP-fucose synthetase [Sulfuricurvum sp. RIFCSPLOWO2_12_43_5]
MFNQNDKIFIAGHKGLLGSAILNQLNDEGFCNLITADKSSLDLTDFAAVDTFFAERQPDIVFLAAGKVGGIIGNKTYPADFLRINLAIQHAVFEAAHKHKVRHVVFYGSSCTYPKLCPQPMKESDWLTGAIEETSMGYAAAKIAGIIAAKSYNAQFGYNKFICLIPNSIYGPNDNFDLENSHVLSSLIRRFYEAKIHEISEVLLWGSGTPKREFIHAHDVASASLFALRHAEHLENVHYNIGSGEDISIKELSETIAGIIGYDGKLVWDGTKPDGAPRKMLDCDKFLALGWKRNINFDEGLKSTCTWLKENYDTIRTS